MILLGDQPIDAEDERDERYERNPLREMEEIPNKVDSQVSSIEWSTVSKARHKQLLQDTDAITQVLPS